MPRAQRHMPVWAWVNRIAFDVTGEKLEGCLGLISLYPKPRPWEDPTRSYLQRIQQAQVQRAAELGYRIEPFWVREPGLRPERLAAIIEARGISIA